MNYNLRPNKGYTLVEILIGLVIITVLFAGGYASYREFVRRQVLKNTLQELKQNIGLARQKTLSGEKPAGCTNTLVGYEIAFNLTSYVVSPKCDVTSPGVGSVSVITVQLPTSVTQSISGFSNPLRFKPISGTNLASNGTVTLTHLVSSTTQSITIKPNGAVE